MTHVETRFRSFEFMILIISELNIAKNIINIEQKLLLFFMFKSPVSECKQAWVRLDAQDPKRNIW